MSFTASSSFDSNMIFTILPLLLSTVSAQYGYGGQASSGAPMSSVAASPSSSSTSSSGSSTIHHVLVGVGGLVFTPNNITAAVGDSVIVRFFSSLVAEMRTRGN